MSRLTLLVVKTLFLFAIGIFLNIVFVAFIKDNIPALRIAQVMLVCGLCTITWLEIIKILRANKIVVDNIPNKKVFKSVNFDIDADQLVAVYAKTAIHFLKHCFPVGLISEKELNYIHELMDTLFQNDVSFVFSLDTHAVLPDGDFDLAILQRYLEAIIKLQIHNKLNQEDTLIMLPKIIESVKNNPETESFQHIKDAFNFYKTKNVKQYDICINNLKNLIALLQQKTGVHFVIRKYIDYDFGKNTESFAFDPGTNINAKSLSEEQWDQASEILKFIEYFKVDLPAL